MADSSLTSIGSSSSTYTMLTGQDFSNLTNIEGTETPAIIPGLSAYDLAVLNGYSGTLEEWLASLHASVDASTVIPTTKNPNAVLGNVVDAALNSLQLDSSGTIDSAKITDPLSGETVSLVDLINELYKERQRYLKNNTDNIIEGDMLTFSGNKDGVDLAFGFSTIRDPLSSNLVSAIYDQYGDSLYYMTPDRIFLSPGNGTPGTSTYLNTVILMGLAAPASSADTGGTVNEIRFDDVNGIIWRKTQDKWLSWYATDSKPGGGGGSSFDPTADQTISGAYDFTKSILVPTVSLDDDSGNAASTEWVNKQDFSKIQEIEVAPDAITLPAGQKVSVSNIGTPTAPILQFSIPEGASGDEAASITKIDINPDMTFTFTMSDGTQSTSESDIYIDGNGILRYGESIGTLPSDLVLNGDVYTAPQAYLNGTETLPAGLYLNSNIVMTDGTVYFPKTINNLGVLCAA